VNPNLSLKPASLADQLMAVDVFSNLLASIDPKQLGRRLTEQLRELTGARTVILIAHLGGKDDHGLMYACPARRNAMFTADELGQFHPDRTPGPLPRQTADFPPEHPLSALLLRVGVESLLRFPLHVGGELLATLLLLDLPGVDRIDETENIVRHLSPAMALALKNALAFERIEEQTRGLEHRVAERTADLEAANQSLSASRLAALNLMEDAVAAQQLAEQTTAELQLEVNERKQAEVALRESETKYRALVENAGEAIFVAQDGRVKFANPQTEKLSGYSREEIMSRPFVEFVHPEERDLVIARHTARMAGGGVPLPTVHRIIRRSGEVCWVEYSATLIEWEGRRATLNFLSDITERKRLEQEAKAMEAQLRQQQKLESIGTLASGVAHEINNPITGIMNYAQLIQDRLPSESPLTEFTGEIMRETQRVATIVRNLLTFARKEQHSSIPASIGDIVEDTLSLIRTLIRRDQIALTVNVPADLPDLKCRSQQIQQVLMNLMTNARDALNERYPGGDPDKEMRVEAGLIEKQGRRWIRVTVEDHGMGIPPAVRERMFDPFFTTKPRDQGTGLGLSISHGIVKEHHGELTVESEWGKFTRMHMDLPVDDGGNP